MSNGDEKLEADIGRVIGKVEDEGQQITEGLGFSTGRQSLESPLVEIPELVNNWVRIGDLSLLVGFGGVGKSTIALNLSLALAGGVPFIGYEVAQAEPVAYLDLEMGEFEFRSRLNMLLPQYPDQAADNFHYACLQNFTMKDKRNERRLNDALAGFAPRLLVVDNHASFHGGDPNKESEMMVNIIIPFREIMAERSLGVLYLMHTPWGERDRPRGTAAIFDAAATVVAVTVPQPDIRQLNWTKRRSVRRQMGASQMEISYNNMTYTIYPSSGAVVDEVLSQISFPAKRSFVAKQLAEALGITVRQGYRRVAAMVEGKQLVDAGRGAVNRGIPRLVNVLRKQGFG